MSGPTDILVTGADEKYFDLLLDLLHSLERTGGLSGRALGILDFGFTAEQCAMLARFSPTIVKPRWDLRVPAELQKEAELGRISRPFLPGYFPGFTNYVWIDADIWVQESRFIDDYIGASEKTGLAIVREREDAYRLQPWLLGWTVKNFIAMFGPLRGGYLCLCEPINNGLFAMKATAPHWAAWAKYYQEGLDRSGKLYNQFSLAAAIHLDKLPVTYMPGTHNWICDRGQPMWDPARNLFCLPYREHLPIQVMHLAGPAKSGRYLIKTTDGGTIERSLRFAATEARG